MKIFCEKAVSKNKWIAGVVAVDSEDESYINLDGFMEQLCEHCKFAVKGEFLDMVKKEINGEAVWCGGHNKYSCSHPAF